MGALQPLHLVLVLIIVLIVFGAGRLTEVGGALGKGVRDFKANVDGKDAGASSAATGARHCTSCGAEIASGARFCAKCGAGVAASS